MRHLGARPDISPFVSEVFSLNSEDDVRKLWRILSSELKGKIRRGQEDISRKTALYLKAVPDFNPAAGGWRGKMNIIIPLPCYPSPESEIQCDAGDASDAALSGLREQCIHEFIEPDLSHLTCAAYV